MAAESVPEEGASSSTTQQPEDPGRGDEQTAAETFDEDYLRLNGGAGNAVDDPSFISADDVSWLDDNDVVLGWVTEDWDAYAFPVMPMAYHHVAQGDIGGEPYLVTY